jgi:subtilisin-like proprotein convertase family protein
MKKKLHYVLSFAMLMLCFSVVAQTNHFKKVTNKGQQNTLQSHQTYSFDVNQLMGELSKAQQRGNSKALSNNLVLELPNLDGELESYFIQEASVMAPELQAQYPQIRSYVGYGIDTPSAYLRFSISPYKGLSGIVLSGAEGKTLVIEPSVEDVSKITISKKNDANHKGQPFECNTPEDLESNIEGLTNKVSTSADGTLHTFDLAMSVSAEYSAFHGGTLPLVNSAIVNTMTTVNAVFENDFNVTMVLVANNDNVVYLNPNTDPYSGTSDNNYNSALQTALDAQIGNANYDVGHLMAGIGNNGNAGCIGCVCVSGQKGSGYTTSTTPTGSSFDIDYVAHELGHQFGARHTFTFSSEGPGIAQMEPGSGTTIMGYAGITGATDVQSNSDPYFHAISIQQVTAHVSTRTCDVETSTGNNVPVANAGSDLILPKGTPFRLTGSATDADAGDTLTYCWEQYDENNAANAFPSATSTNNNEPLFRSYSPTTNPTRTFPKLSDLVGSGFNASPWEQVPTVSRTADFRLTVRDNKPGGAANDFDDMVVSWSATAGPFLVTSQNATTTWSPGNTETITWDVSGTDTGAINEQNVDILLSVDGGQTFTTVLASGVPNNGSYDVVVPNVLAESCRIMVQAASGTFFNINDVPFGIGYNTTPGDECNTYTFTLNQAITPNAAAFEFFDFNVTDFGTITDVNVKYDITTTALNDLHMAILSPSGTRAYLYAAGACGNDGSANMQVTFDDEASGPIVCGTNPLTGTATTANIATPEPLSGMDGEEMNGTWSFMVANVGSTAMTFNSVELEICIDGMTVTLAPERVNQEVVTVDLLSSATIETTDLKVTSPNTTTTTDIVYTISELPTLGSVYLNGTALVLNDTFTQADVDAGVVSYTTTSGVVNTDGFRVDVDDNNGGDLPNLLVEIEIVDALSTDDFALENSFSIYPNPNNGEFNVKFKSASNNVTLELFDIRGRSIYTKGYNNSGAFNETINLGNVQSGMYLLNVNDGSRTFTKKIIVE